MSALHLISIGPGDLNQVTSAASIALSQCQLVIGYAGYIEQIRQLVGKRTKVVTSQLGDEMKRAEEAVVHARSGTTVGLVSSGDIGIYAMASPVFDVLRKQNWDGSEPEVIVHPGVSAIQATAARLGAPLGHDFCTISLSDLLTPWPVIERRVHAAAWGDFVVGFYNPRSRKRDWQLDRALSILTEHRSASTPVAIAHNVTRPDEYVKLTTLCDVHSAEVDMFTLVLVGNSQSYTMGNRMATPRGYADQLPDQDRSGVETNRRDGAPPPGVSSKNESPVMNQHGADSAPQGTFTERESQSVSLGAEELHHHQLYPVCLTNLANQTAVVIGGGPVATRKVTKLLDLAVNIRVISPRITPQLRLWYEEERLEWLPREFRSGDLTGARLVFAATNNRSVNREVASEANDRMLLCNVADAPSEGNFHVPALLRQDGYIIAVNSQLANPTQSVRLRDAISNWMRTQHDR